MRTLAGPTAAMAGSNMKLLTCVLLLLLTGANAFLTAPAPSKAQRSPRLLSLLYDCTTEVPARPSPAGASPSAQPTVPGPRPRHTGLSTCFRLRLMLVHVVKRSPSHVTGRKPLPACHWQGRLRLRRTCSPGSCCRAAAPLLVRTPRLPARAQLRLPGFSLATSAVLTALWTTDRC